MSKTTTDLIDDARANIADASGRLHDSRRIMDNNAETAVSVLQMAKARLKNAIASTDAAIRDLKEEMANQEPATPESRTAELPFEGGHARPRGGKRS